MNVIGKIGSDVIYKIFSRDYFVMAMKMMETSIKFCYEVNKRIM